jgi:hypothetical protein
VPKLSVRELRKKRGALQATNEAEQKKLPDIPVPLEPYPQPEDPKVDEDVVEIPSSSEPKRSASSSLPSKKSKKAKTSDPDPPTDDRIYETASWDAEGWTMPTARANCIKLCRELGQPPQPSGLNLYARDIPQVFAGRGLLDRIVDRAHYKTIFKLEPTALADSVGLIASEVSLILVLVLFSHFPCPFPVF